MKDAGSPFDCKTCSEADKAARNCMNRLKLSDASRAAFQYTDEVKAEIKRTEAVKVWSTGDIRLYECPLSLFSDPDLEAIRRAVYLSISTGTMMYSGGFAEQPCWFIEALEIHRIEALRRKEKEDDRGNGK